MLRDQSKDILYKEMFPSPLHSTDMHCQILPACPGLSMEEADALDATVIHCAEMEPIG